MKDEDPPTFTVKELMERLAEMPPDARVWTDGCDCWGECRDVVLGDDGIVTIMREQKKGTREVK